jgi:hypothetical protein
MPLFGKSQKSPAEVVKSLKEAVCALERGDKKAEKVTTLSMNKIQCSIEHSLHRDENFGNFRSIMSLITTRANICLSLVES